MEKIKNLWSSVVWSTNDDESNIYLDSELTYFEVATSRNGCVAILGFSYPEYPTVHYHSGYLTADQVVLAYQAMTEWNHNEIKIRDL